MEEIDKALQFLNKVLEKQPQLVHASNIVRKCTDESGHKLKAAQMLAIDYVEYLKAHFSIKGYTEDVIKRRVELLNNYYDYYDNSKYDYNKLFTSQGKLRPTILEEFFYLLFRDYLRDIQQKVKDDEKILGIGSAKAYTNLYFSPISLKGFVEDPSIKLNVKDQDFAIFREVPFQVGGNKKKTFQAKVPILAVEVKTYLDKTMLEGVVATAEKLKMGNPYARFVVASESYQVDLSVDPSYSQIDQIYVLRKCGAMRRLTTIPPIHHDVVWRMFCEAKEHIERPWSDVQSKLENDGVII